MLVLRDFNTSAGAAGAGAFYGAVDEKHDSKFD